MTAGVEVEIGDAGVFGYFLLYLPEPVRLVALALRVKDHGNTTSGQVRQDFLGVSVEPHGFARIRVDVFKRVVDEFSGLVVDDPDLVWCILRSVVRPCDMSFASIFRALQPFEADYYGCAAFWPVGLDRAHANLKTV
ncbi:MAG: hypothetical protein RLN85_05550 [Pseudomonadales bacterium]